MSSEYYHFPRAQGILFFVVASEYFLKAISMGVYRDESLWKKNSRRKERLLEKAHFQTPSDGSTEGWALEGRQMNMGEDNP